ncbi:MULTISPECIES: hypothetical protein [unclassified Leifsonia]|uniref:hypothetical protein n=1 Tax=unclassified Leifsonia TaxID=2663824 RepID=UPI000701C2B4|nr:MULTISPECIES: hypothetical protein [unclassified Leifsonia]KQX07886.1 hypothetical protein ASC59_09260 [Leifsonia sp. Root1293]KRA12167.1 hypothetical protein ASD61_09260 [Leifsonia sp. Root60]
MRAPLPTTPENLVLSRRAGEVGMADTLRSARRAGELVRMRRGVYMPETAHRDLTERESYRTRALAVGEQRARPVYAGFTAAVMHGLPVVDGFSPEVFLLSPTSSGRRRNGVVELGRRDPAELVVVDGVVATAVPDTVIDVARSRSLLQALVMADAALRVDRFGEREPLCTSEELRSAFERRLPFPGSRRVAAVLDRATTLAESPLETLSRLRIEELGFPAPTLQYPVTLPSGSTVHLDLAWPEYAAWGEADGDGKYLGLLPGPDDRRSPGQIVAAEKKREDAVRSAMRWTCGRWDWAEA